jgi:hypothetical protein
MTKYSFLILCLGLLVGIVGAQFEGAPYLYYYSHALNGIVVERADGTDSRLIGQGLIQYPKQVTEVFGPGWSPDGRWFAWRTGHAWGWSEGAVVSVDGKKSLDLLRNFHCVRSMVWSPDSQYLMVYGIVKHHHTALECNQRGMSSDFWLIHVPTGKRLAAFTVHDCCISSYNAVLNLDWSARQVEFYLSETFGEDYESIPYGSVPVHVSMGFDGTVLKTPGEERQSLFVEREYPAPGDDEYVRLPDSPDGRYQMIGDEFDEDRALMDTVTGQRVELPWHNSAVDDKPIFLNWHSSGEWVLPGYEACFAGCSFSVGWMSIFNPTTGMYRELAECCPGWLPERVDVKALPDGRSEPLLLSPNHIEYEFNELKYATGWLYDQATHQLACNKKPREGIWLGEMTQVQTLEGGLIFTLPHNFPCVDSNNDFNQIEFDTDVREPAILALSPDGRFAALADNKHFAELYDVKTHERLATLNIGAIGLWFSEDSRTLYTRSRFSVAEWNVAEVIAHARSGMPS